MPLFGDLSLSFDSALTVHPPTLPSRRAQMETSLTTTGFLLPTKYIHRNQTHARLTFAKFIRLNGKVIGDAYRVATRGYVLNSSWDWSEETFDPRAHFFSCDQGLCFCFVPPEMRLSSQTRAHQLRPIRMGYGLNLDGFTLRTFRRWENKSGLVYRGKCENIQITDKDPGDTPYVRKTGCFTSPWRLTHDPLVPGWDRKGPYYLSPQAYWRLREHPSVPRTVRTHLEQGWRPVVPLVVVGLAMWLITDDFWDPIPEISNPEEVSNVNQLTLPDRMVDNLKAVTVSWDWVEEY